MSVSVTVNYNHLPRITARFTPAEREITQIHAFKVHEAADPNTPRDTGDLANNVTVGPDFVTWNMSYAAYPNFGTVHMAGNLYATNAANLVYPQWVQALSQIEGRL